MAVPEQTPYQEFIANGSTNRFGLNFLCKKKEHLIVKLNDAEANVEDWTFTNNAVVFSIAPSTGVKVSIQRRTPNKRSANYQSYNSSFSPNAVNEDFDALWMRLQEEEVAKAFLNQLIEMNYEDLDEKGQAIRLELINQLTEKTTQLDQAINNKTSQLDQKIQSNALQLQNQIIQQGVSQQQIDTYAKSLLKNIATLSSDKGWLADLVVDGEKTQKQINDYNYHFDGLMYENALVRKNKLKEACQLYSTVIIKNGNHDIDLSDGIPITPKDGCRIIFEPEAHLNVIPNALERVYLFDLNGTKNVRIEYAWCTGDKYTHLGTTGQWAHCINADGSENAIILSPRISKFWGDGIYIKKAKNLKIYHPHLVDNRRQGLSIISVDGLEVHFAVCKDTSGQAPAYGVDIEPNWAGESSRNVKFFNPYFENNGERGSYTGGFCISTHRTHLIEQTGVTEIPETIIEVELFNPVFKGDALIVSAYTDNVKGYFISHGAKFIEAKNSALLINNHQSRNFKSTMFNTTFENCVTDKTTIYENAVSIEVTVDAKQTNGTCNFEMIGIDFKSDTLKEFAIRNLTKNVVTRRDGSTFTVTDDLKGVKFLDVYAPNYQAAFSSQNGTVDNLSKIHSDFEFQERKRLDNAKVLGVNSSIRRLMDRSCIKYTAATINANYYLPDDLEVCDFEYTFYNQSLNKAAKLSLMFGTVDLASHKYVVGLNDNRLLSSIVLSHGASVTIKKTASNTFEIVRSVGIVQSPFKVGVSVQHEFGVIAANALIQHDFTFNGVLLTDTILADMNVNIGACRLWAAVTTANNVRVYVKNYSDVEQTIPIGLLSLKVI